MLKPLKVFIVEDMAISRASLESILTSNGFVISGSVAKAEIAWEKLQESKTDLVLIDINLAGQKNGIWLGQQIRQNLKLPIIYLTAYGDQKTLKEVLATKPNGYLMKPYQEPTLLTTINIALTNFFEQKEEKKQPNLESEIKNFLFIKDRFMRVKLEIKEILFIKSDGNYLEINLENKTHVVRSKLSEFLKLLPNTIFLQTHQRYVINVTKIKIIGKDFLSIKNNDIPISLKYKKTIEKALSFF